MIERKKIVERLALAGVIAGTSFGGTGGRVENLPTSSPEPREKVVSSLPPSFSSRVKLLQNVEPRVVYTPKQRGSFEATQTDESAKQPTNKERLTIIPEMETLPPTRESNSKKVESEVSDNESDDEFYNYLVDQLKKQGNPWTPTKHPVRDPENVNLISLDEVEGRAEVTVGEEIEVTDTIPISYRVPITIAGEALNQGACNTCAAFALGETFRMQLAMEDSVQFDPSEAYMYWCRDGDETPPQSCATGALGYLHILRAIGPEGNNELVNESCFPYNGAREGIDLACHEACSEPEVTMRVMGYKYLPESQSQLLAYMAETGYPVPTYMNIHESFYHYGGGIYYGPVGPEDDLVGGHALVVIGYNLEDGENGFWLVRNSWGPGWGEDGNIRVAMSPGEEFIEGFATDLLPPINPYIIRSHVYIPLVSRNF